MEGCLGIANSNFRIGQYYQSDRDSDLENACDTPNYENQDMPKVMAFCNVFIVHAVQMQSTIQRSVLLLLKLILYLYQSSRKIGAIVEIFGGVRIVNLRL